MPNAIRDLEEMNLKEKLDWLRANRDVKCEVKWEVNDEHEFYRKKANKPLWWGVSGLTQNGLTINVLARDDERFEECSVITVDIGVNLNDDGTEHVTKMKPS
jgi:hypothetical protein